MPQRTRQIALAFPTSISHLEHSLKGIHDYMKRHAQWTLLTGAEVHFLPIRSLVGWNGDGVIGMINTPADARAARKLPMPVVNISGALPDAGVPRVRLDYVASGRLAAELLLDRGFRRFAFYGLRRIWYPDQYAQGFFEAARAHGGDCHRHDGPSSIGSRQPWNMHLEQLEAWLLRLPKPIGLMAANDRRAAMVIDACLRLGIRVPQEVAVIGADNDRLMCEQCDPPLTSISRSGERIGFEVAALLDRLMSGKPPPAEDLVIPPEGIVQRASTEVLTIEDPKLRAAVDYMRAHAAAPITIDTVATQVNVSRRWLEYAFRFWLRRSPGVFLEQLRVERARRMLDDADKPKLSVIAHACGFSGNRQLNAAFRRVTGASLRQQPGRK